MKIFNSLSFLRLLNVIEIICNIVLAIILIVMIALLIGSLSLDKDSRVTSVIECELLRGTGYIISGIVLECPRASSPANTTQTITICSRGMMHTNNIEPSSGNILSDVHV